jgi:diguanylate cyclase (GGDEF)-like protein
MKRVSVRVGEGLAGWVAEQGQPLLIEDIEVHPLFGKKSRAKYSTKSLLSVPLQFRGETLGVLNVNNKDNDAVFTTKDQEVLMMLAGQAAIAFENARLYRELEQLAITDGLTRLYVRRHFLELLNNELRRAQRYHRSLSLLMIDIDHFKAVNDTYGHPQGDQVLQELSGLLRRYGRRDDIVARYGGEEFVVALVETDQHGAAQAAERIRRAVEQHEFRVGTERLRLTLSIGVAGYPRDAGNQGDLIVAADQALYAAKRQGRNRVCLFDPADPGTGMVPVRPPESAPEHQGEEDLSARSAAK